MFDDFLNLSDNYPHDSRYVKIVDTYKHIDGGISSVTCQDSCVLREDNVKLLVWERGERL